MDQAVILEIAGAIITFMVTFGAVQTKVARLEKQLDNVDTHLDRIKENYVPQVQFKDAIEDIKIEQRELRADIREILTILREFKSTTRS